MNVSTLTLLEARAVLATLLNVATPAQRIALMRTCPVAYLKLCDGHPTIRETVLREVARAMDGADVQVDTAEVSL